MTNAIDCVGLVADAFPRERGAALMPARNLTPEDEAWLRQPGRKFTDLADRSPELFAVPMSGAHAMMILDKLDEIIALLKRAER